MDILIKEVANLNSEINRLFKKILKIEGDILSLAENFDFVKDQNNRILEIFSKNQIDHNLITEIKNLNKNLGKQKTLTLPTEELDKLSQQINRLSLEKSGKEIFAKESSNTFYKYV